MKAEEFRAVLIGGLVGGALDIAFAISFAAYNGTTPVRLLQIVASGAVGKAALDGGVPMAAFGLGAHFALSLAWATLYLLLARSMPRFAVRHAVLGGVVFGILVFLAMRLVVLPVSAFPFPVRWRPVATVSDLLSHMFLFGLPIALAIRRAIRARAARGTFGT
jgi:uncharacterized membrane protein YagU involved in acid resistance